MINHLDRTLSRLLRGAGAQAAVIWSLHSHPREGIVLTSCPLALLPTGTAWPVVADPGADRAVQDRAGLAALVPTTLRIGLSAAPTAARSVKLGDGNLYLLMVWCGVARSAELSDDLRRLIREDISYLASVLEDSRFNRGEVERLRATVDELEVGLVSLDPGLGQASVNAAAAKLLNLPQGKNEASAFAAAMAHMSRRALNQDEVARMQVALHSDSQAEVDAVWRFGESPTNVRVVSHPTRHGGFTGRVWAFHDESDLSRALDDSEQARAQLRANTDALLDPQVLLEAVRDPAGRVSDFVYRDVNTATCDYLGLTRADLIGHQLVESLPALESSGLLGHYGDCLDTGEPVVLDDFSYDNEILRDSRRYDIRATRAGPDLLTLTWRDVTDRFELAQRVSESERRFRLLAENIGDVVCHVSDDGTFVWVSSAIQTALGAPPVHYLGSKVRDIIAPEDQANHADRLTAVVGGRPYVGRAKLLGADGTAHWVHLFLKPYYDAEGRRDGIVSTFRVIDDEVAAEQQLEDARAQQAEADARYRKLIDNSIVATALNTPQGRFIVVNAAICDFFGYPEETLVGKTWQDLTAPEHLEADLGAVGDVQAGRRQSYRVTKQYIHADGHPIWGDLSMSCIRNPDGSVESMVCQILDVTAQVTAQQELARYRQLVETSTVGTALSNLDGSMAMVNQAMCDLAGFDMDTAMQMTWTQVIPEPHLQALLRAAEDLVAGRIDSYRGDHVFIHADGNPRWIDMSLSLMRTPDGQPGYIIFQSVDITAAVHAREQLQVTRALLAASADSMLDPQVLFEAVRDPAGRVRDLRYVSANPASLAYLRLSEEELLGRTALETLPNLEESGLLARYAQCLADGEPVVLTDFSYYNEMIADARRYDISATRAGPDLLTLSWTDVTDRFHAAQRIAASEEQYRLLADNSTDIVCHVRDGSLVWVSPSIERILGAPPAYWLGREVFAHIPPEDTAEQLALMAKVMSGGAISHRGRVIGVDGVTHWFDLRARPFIGADGRQDGVAASLRVVDEEVAAERRADEARRLQARADALYRRSMDSAAVGMCLADLDGTFVEVNKALCEFFGYDAETLRNMTWQQLTDPDYLEADLSNREQVLAGAIESYRMTKRFIHADGHPIWGDLSVSCIRDAAGQVELFTGQIVDTTTEVLLAQSLRQQTERLTSQLDSAAAYIRSILPGELRGSVQVSSRYLPSEGLGGDCFDYRWVGDDHLIVYLLDVSGHGMEPALVSISVHNMLRSGSLPVATLLEPDRVLGELNDRFPMEQQGGNYFTIWYGVYELSSRTLRYASAGHPPALLYTPARHGTIMTELSTEGLPIGMFPGFDFPCATCTVAPGSQLVLPSDGAYELPQEDGREWSREDFVALCTRLAGSPDWSLDTLIELLRAESTSGVFDDDVSLVKIVF